MLGADMSIEVKKRPVREPLPLKVLPSLIERLKRHAKTEDISTNALAEQFLAWACDNYEADKKKR